MDEKEEEVRGIFQDLLDKIDLKKELIQWLLDEWDYQEKYADAFIEIKPNVLGIRELVDNKGKPE